MSSSNKIAAEPAARRTGISVPPVAISPEEWKLVVELLRRHLPGREVWAYGSRATGRRVKRFSDLDLIVEGGKLPDRALGEVADAFDESALPFKVDVAEGASLDPEFRKRIEADRVILIAAD